jgi:putative colanic acid biosynthesis UDP-glucose lipid carrier transferase
MLPFIPIIAYFIKRQSPGPLFFKQERTGLNGKTFICYKFRSMHVNKDADRVQATKNDPRKFPFGEFIRHTNLDEFPQFYNVLKGDMSIVGPRPHMLAHTKQYSSIIDKYMVRHFSLPGITGYAQVSGCRGETKELWQMEERIKKDIWYIENWSFWLDIKIILKTAVTLIVPDQKAY